VVLDAAGGFKVVGLHDTADAFLMRCSTESPDAFPRYQDAGGGGLECQASVILQRRLLEPVVVMTGQGEVQRRCRANEAGRR